MECYKNLINYLNEQVEQSLITDIKIIEMLNKINCDHIDNKTLYQQWYEKNKHSQKKYYQNHKEYYKNYYQQHKDEIRERYYKKKLNNKENNNIVENN